MSARKILVDCRFSDEGEDFRLLLAQSFHFFLERELKNNKFKLAFSKAVR